MIDINSQKYLHFADSASTAGMLKHTLNKGAEIFYIELDLATGCLPHDLSLDEYNRCKSHQLWDFGDGMSFKLFGAELSKYDGIIVWHSSDVSSMLNLAFIVSAYLDEIWHIDISEKFQNRMCGQLTADELKSCVTLCKKITSSKRKSLSSKYHAIWDCPAATPKAYISNRFKFVDVNNLKRCILRYAPKNPKGWHYPYSFAMGHSPIGRFYSSMFWEILTLELVIEGKLLISEMQLEETTGAKFPLGCCFTKSYMLHGFDLGKLYSFKVFNPKGKLEKKQCDLSYTQRRILATMYEIQLFPYAKPKSSEKIITQTLCNFGTNYFSDSVLLLSAKP